jgi:hypothetical protein
MIDMLKTKAVLVYDTGLFLSLTESLVGQFGRVFFYNPQWKAAFPSSLQLYIGDGIKGVERVEHFWDVVREYRDRKQDILFCFPDIHNGDLQQQLIEMGYFVWGSRRADEIELDRWEFKNTVLKDLNMPVQPIHRIIGTDKLRTFLKDPKNTPCYVKVSLTRGDMESRKHFDYDASLLWINEIEHKYGPLAQDMEFICEMPIPTTLELGGDKWNIDGKWPEISMHGIEMKDAGYFGCVMKQVDMPAPIKYVDDKIASVLRDYQGGGFRGKISTEIRIGKDGKFYFLDPCMRFGSPPHQIECALLKNLGLIMFMGAQGIMVKPEYIANYGVQAFIYSERCDKEWLCYKYPKELEQWYKFSFKCVVDGKTYTIPQNCGMSAMGSVVAIDNDPLKAIKKLVEYSSKLEGEGLDVRLDAIPKAMKEAHEAMAKGYRFGVGYIPTLEQVAKLVI